MFNALFRQAQQTVESSLHQVVDRALLAVLFLASCGFVAAAASVWLVGRYGTVQGLLIVASGLLVLTMLTALVQRIHSNRLRSSAPAAPPPDAEDSDRTADRGGTIPMSDADKELLLSGLTAVSPMLAPKLIGLILRNLPILAVLGAFIFVMTRSSEEEQHGTPQAGQSGLTAAE